MIGRRITGYYERVKYEGGGKEICYTVRSEGFQLVSNEKMTFES